MGDQKKLQIEVEELKKEIEELKKKNNFFEALQKHYEEEKAYIALIENKIADLFMTINKKHTGINTLEYAMRMYKNKDEDEENIQGTT